MLEKRLENFDLKDVSLDKENIKKLKNSHSKRYFELLAQRNTLPAFSAKNHLLDLMVQNNIIIVQGETGSGKTTQLPQFMLEADWLKGQIAVTQPRRIAAVSVSKRVSEEMDVILGQEVGYTIRFEDCTSEKTRLKYLTDGMLIRELELDHLLSKYSVIVIDEAHERTLNSDILLAMLKKLIYERKDNLKLVIMSATIEVDRFVKYFEGKAPLLTIPGRTFPVEVKYSKRAESDYLSAATKTVLNIHQNEIEGDILLFLTGEEEIEKAASQIINESQTSNSDLKLEVLTLYGSMSTESQQRVFKPTPIGYRKVVISTNIAETSVTIDGIVFVVDCGLAKQKVYNPRLRFESLLISPISQAAANQRSGRAGRTRPGKCYRLYTKDSFKNELLPYSIPEILRCELSGLILSLKLLGISNIVEFDFMEAPAPETLFRALENLVLIGAIDENTGELTKIGETLGRFPLEPQFSRVLLASKYLNVQNEVSNIIAVLTSGNWRTRPMDSLSRADEAHKKFYSENNCDILTINNVMNSFFDSNCSKKYSENNYLNYRVLSTAVNVKNQLLRLLTAVDECDIISSKILKMTSDKKIKFAFLSGFYQQIVHFTRNSGIYQVLNETTQVIVHPSVSFKSKPQFLLYLEFVLTSKNYIRTVSDIDPKWLSLLYPVYFNEENIKSSEIKKFFI